MAAQPWVAEDRANAAAHMNACALILSRIIKLRQDMTSPSRARRLSKCENGIQDPQRPWTQNCWSSDF
jgi:hypothetical protein